ncbi:MAG: hypothetical protein ACI9HK_001513, partial [Pirellulaceae bacterium]
MNSILPHLLFAQDSEPRMSLVAWMFNALGPFYGLLLPAVGLLVFIVGVIVV